MKNSIFSISIILSLICIVSCSIDEYDLTDVKTDPPTPEVIYTNQILSLARSGVEDEGVRIRCGNLMFPFSLLSTDSMRYTVTNETEFNAVFSGSSAKIVDFVYPLHLFDAFGSLTEVNNIQEFAVALSSCLPDDISQSQFQAYNINIENSCYSLIFPVEVEDAGGRIYSVKNELELAARSADSVYYFHFPIDLKDLNGQTVSIQDAGMLASALINCNTSPFGDPNVIVFGTGVSLGCYQHVYPFDILLTDDNTQITVKSEEEFSTILFMGRFLDYVYPVRLRKEDQTIISVNSPEDLFMALLSCGGQSDLIFLLSGTEYFRPDPCYDLVFPFSVYNQPGDTLTIHGSEDIEAIFSDSLANFDYRLIFPVEVIKKINSQREVLTNDGELFRLLEECP